MADSDCWSGPQRCGLLAGRGGERGTARVKTRTTRGPLVAGGAGRGPLVAGGAGRGPLLLAGRGADRLLLAGQQAGAGRGPESAGSRRGPESCTAGGRALAELGREVTHVYSTCLAGARRVGRRQLDKYTRAGEASLADMAAVSQLDNCTAACIRRARRGCVLVARYSRRLGARSGWVLANCFSPIYIHGPPQRVGARLPQPDVLRRRRGGGRGRRGAAAPRRPVRPSETHSALLVCWKRGDRCGARRAMHAGVGDGGGTSRMRS